MAPLLFRRTNSMSLFVRQMLDTLVSCGEKYLRDIHSRVDKHDKRHAQLD